MIPEFDLFGLYFSSIVPRFLLCLALWVPVHGLLGSLRIRRWVYLPAWCHLSIFLLLLAAVTFCWHP